MKIQRFTKFCDYINCMKHEFSFNKFFSFFKQLQKQAQFLDLDQDLESFNEVFLK